MVHRYCSNIHVANPGHGIFSIDVGGAKGASPQAERAKKGNRKSKIESKYSKYSATMVWYVRSCTITSIVRYCIVPPVHHSSSLIIISSSY